MDKPPLQFETTQVKLEENGFRLDLTLIDTPGFGAFVDNSKALDPILSLIDNEFKKTFESELSIDQRFNDDNCIHACLYFIAPTGHGLKEIDKQFMKKLNTKVNIIPVIAKSDAFLPQELSMFKQNVRDNTNLCFFPKLLKVSGYVLSLKFLAY